MAFRPVCSCWIHVPSFPLLQRLVVKPDQLIKRRGKLGLVGVDLDLQGVQDWLRPRLMRETTVSSTNTVILTFSY